MDQIAAADQIAAGDLSVAADQIAAVDPNAAGDRYGEAAHTAAPNAVAVDRYGEAAHTAAPNAAAGDRYEGAVQIVEAVPNVPAVQSAVVDRFFGVARNEPVDLIAVPNAALIFPSAQLDRVSMVLRAERKARSAETRIVAMKTEGDCQTDVMSQSAAVRAMAYYHRRHAVLVGQPVRADRHAFPSYAAMLTCQVTE